MIVIMDITHELEKLFFLKSFKEILTNRSWLDILLNEEQIEKIDGTGVYQFEDLSLVIIDDFYEAKYGRFYFLERKYNGLSVYKYYPNKLSSRTYFVHFNRKNGLLDGEYKITS